MAVLNPAHRVSAYIRPRPERGRVQITPLEESRLRVQTLVAAIVMSILLVSFWWALGAGILLHFASRIVVRHSFARQARRTARTAG